jgi:hypothetical protein
VAGDLPELKAFSSMTGNLPGITSGIVIVYARAAGSSAFHGDARGLRVQGGQNARTAIIN